VPAWLRDALHVHSRENETSYVIEGQIRYVCGDSTGSGGPRTSLHLPRGVPHAFATAGDAPLRLLHMASPSGMEGFHMAVGVPASGPPPDPSTGSRGDRSDGG
jgi:mannose-6-phosphate isomerase-like protein (cupin superfamily)